MLKNQLNKYSLRKTKDILDLPPKTIIPEYLDMEDDQSRFYNNVKQGIKEEVNKVKLTTSSLLAMATRLRQVTSLPDILTSENISNVKIDRACELTNEIIQNGDKVVIFSSYKDVITKLNEKLKQYNPVLGTGDISDNDLANNINKFQDDPNNKIFIEAKNIE